MNTIPFYKYQAAGNDFILIDTKECPNALRVAQKNAKVLCDRHFGIGGDGVLVLEYRDDVDVFMHIINGDGSVANMCGNGIRCAALHLYHSFSSSNPLQQLSIDTRGGLQHIRFLDSKGGSALKISVAIARSEIQNDIEIIHQNERYKGLQVDVGNPHAVFECRHPKAALEQSGEYLSHHPLFPDRSNIELIREIAPNELEFYVYERGVGPTLACGTGCVAAARAYAYRHQTFGDITIHAPGGDLMVRVPEDSTLPIELMGDAHQVFEGRIHLSDEAEIV